MVKMRLRVDTKAVGMAMVQAGLETDGALIGLADISYPTLKAVRRNRRASIGVIERIANALGVNPLSLLVVETCAGENGA